MEKQKSAVAPINLSKKATSRNRDRRRTENGDISPVLTDDGIESYVVDESIDAALSSKETATQDILSKIKTGDTQTLAATLETILAGASPDDATKLRRALLDQIQPVITKRKSHPDGTSDGTTDQTAPASGAPCRASA